MMAERVLVEELEESGWPGFPDALLVRDAVPAQMFPPLDSRSPKCLLLENTAGSETGSCPSCHGCIKACSSL